MKVRWLWIALAVVASCVAVAFLVAVVQPSPQDPTGGKFASVPSTSIAAQGTDTTISSIDGSPEVRIPAQSLRGSGHISIRPVMGGNGLKGWNISLDGADLVGKATLRFKNVVVTGAPPPLVGFTENNAEDITPVDAFRVIGSDVEVDTTHFSNWFIQSWEWLSAWAKDRIAAMFTAAPGPDPACANQDAVQSDGITAAGSQDDSVHWCLGKTTVGATVLTLKNPAGYAVTAESTPGATIGGRNTDMSEWVPKLAKFLTLPSKAQNDVEILGPGEVVAYTIDTNRASPVGVKIMPSPLAYQATVLHFAAETAVMMYGRFHKGSSPLTISAALDTMAAADCAAAIQGMTVSSDVSTPGEAAAYVNATLQAVWPCLGKTMERLAAQGSEAFAVLAGGVVSWLESGLVTIVAGISAAADTIMHPDGYQIVVTFPEGLQTFQGAYGTGVNMQAQPSPYRASVEFRYPSSWTVSPTPLPPLMEDTKNGVGIVSGTGLHEFQIVFYADLNEPCGALPASQIQATPVTSRLNFDDGQGQRWIISTLFHPPPGYGYNFPVVLTVQLSDAPTAIVEGQSCPGIASFKVGPVFARFLHQRGFNTDKEAADYLESTEYRQITGVITSLQVSVH